MPRILRQPFQPSAVAVTRTAIGPISETPAEGCPGHALRGGWLGQASGGIFIPAGAFVCVEVTDG